jgi:DNA polymerase-3 subunit epsilon
MRQIILDTETTGLRVEEGHRLIEIGCLEMYNRKLTGSHYHAYINPGRPIEAGAIAVHGITSEFLQNKPSFYDIVDEFMSFVANSELIIHNAPFDLSFINNELQLTRQGRKRITEHCDVIDTLQMARQMHVGQRHSLDALCKRYKVDNSKRELHGALLDAHLLAQVYLAMTGGQGSFFEAPHPNQMSATKSANISSHQQLQQYKLVVQKADVNELNEHENYLTFLKKQGNCVWKDSEALDS